MTRKLKRPLALLSSLAMMLTCLPGNMAQVLTATAGAADTVTFTVITGAPDGFDNEGYDNLLDGATNTKWCCNFDGSASVVIKASQLVMITGYSIATGNDSLYESGRNPVAWTLSGCNDYDEAYKSGTWVVLDTITDGGLPAANETYTDFEIQDAAGKYQYFKLNITQVKDGSLMQIGELKLEYTTCDHQWELTGNVVDPTCEEDGYEIAKCAVCGEEKKTPNGVPATGHDWVEEKTVAPTCVDDGYVVKKCSVCDAERQEFNGEYATGHDWVVEKTVAPTCADDGYVVKKCSVCGTERQMSNGEYATGHDWVEKENVPATCYKDGYVVEKCSRCSTEQQRSNGESATGHEFDASSDEPDVCIRCGYLRFTVSKPATDAEGRYMIGTPGELYWFAGRVNDTLPDDAGELDANAILTADITINSDLIESLGVDQKTGIVSNVEGLHAWVPIGYNSSHVYSGTFDGNNHTISGLYCDIDSEKNRLLGTEYIGLFGHIKGTVQNLNITDSYFNGKSEVGALCGWNDTYSTLSNCTADAVVAANKTIEGEYTEANVGGLSGYSQAATVRNCSFAGAVYFGGSATYPHVGGLLGMMCVTSADHCYTTAKIYSKKYTPLFGMEFDTKASNCYYLADSESTADPSAKTAAQFASGEVAYLLGQGYPTNEGDVTSAYTGPVWGQEIGKDALPVLNGMTVYRNEEYTGCVYNPGDPTYSYANTAAEPKYGDYPIENGICQHCGGYEPAVLNEAGVYEISNAGNLYWFAELVNGTLKNVERNASAKAILTANITVNENLIVSLKRGANGEEFNSWTPIGYGVTSDGDLIVFDGIFDGQGYSISGLYHSASYRTNLALFGRTGENAIISNVKVVDTYFYANPQGNYVAGVCGQNYGTIKNCQIDGMITGNEYAAGICGQNYGTIKNCRNGGTIDGSDYISGICGDNLGTISDCYNTGTITGTDFISGVCGQNRGTIKNCYNTGSATGGDYVSGVCGQNYGTVENSYNTGSISGSWWVSGVCGNNTGLVVNCYNTGKIMAESASDAVCGISNSDENVVNCYYLDSCAAEGSDLRFQLGESKTIEQFNSGEVAFLLRQDYTTGEGEDAVTCDGSVWGQEIGTDDLPLLNGKTVYHNTRYAGCNSTSPVAEEFYSNTDQNIYGPHRGFAETGICSDCGLLEEPVLNESGFYEISNAGNLYWFAGLVNGTLDGVDQNTFANALLTADITVNEGLLASLTVDENNEVTNGDSFRNWMPIGGGATSFDGMFVGQDHTISGLYLNDSIRQSGGLFGKTGEGAAIVNVKIADSYFNAYGPVGGVCGYNGGTIANCSNAGTVSGQRLVGGICGYNERIVADCSNAGTVSGGYGIGGVCGSNACVLTNCCNTGAVSGATYMGGVCGIAQSPDGDGQHMDRTISNCYNTGDVTGSSDSIGGICGVCCDYTISNCYNTGAIHGDIKVGGLCGYNDFSTVTNSYNIGIVSGTDDVGGLFGRNSGSAVNCYYLDSCAAEGTVFDSVCGESKTIEQFHSGEAAYLLGQGCTIGADADEVTYSGYIWGQEIGKDDLPGLNRKTVYRNEEYAGCVHDPGDPTYVYANTASEPKHGDFTFENGICPHCGGYEPAVLNEAGVYEISNAGNLYWFAGLVNGTLDGVDQNTSAKAILTADITVNEDLLASLTFDTDNKVTNNDSFRAWTPIGGGVIDSTSSGVTQYICYDGAFDGQDHTISGLYLNDSERQYAGLFGKTGEGASIVNVKIADSYFMGQAGVGGVCGFNGGTIANCSNAGMISAPYYSGGVCGGNTSKLINCYNTGTVTGETGTGGVCGASEPTQVNGTYTNCIIENCYNTGEINGDFYAGGLCGLNNKGVITNSYNTGTVVGTGSYFGGLCGGSYGVTANCYSTGSIKSYGGVHAIGGLCGTSSNNIVNCYFLDSCATGELNFDFTCGESKTIEQFNSGEVAYLLQQGSIVGDGDAAVIYEGVIWGQEIGKDDLPDLNGKTVYRNEVYAGCVHDLGDPTYVYANTAAEPKHGDYIIENGICQYCGLLEAAVLNEDGVYEISNAGQLYWFAGLVNGTLNRVAQNTSAKAILTADITVNEDLLASLTFNEYHYVTNGDSFRAWTPIGGSAIDSTSSEETQYICYDGEFDGQNHTISGLFYDTRRLYVGLFGRTGENAKISNVQIADSYFHGPIGTGGICGCNGGTITNCSNAGMVSGNDSGGVCGQNQGTITNCYNTGTVIGVEGAGGVCGNNDGTIDACYNTGEVKSYASTPWYYGGVCGQNQGTITNCYNTGSVNANNYVGGICGNNAGLIVNSYNTGSYGGVVYVGSVCGNLAGDGKVVNCYCLDTDGGDSYQGEGKTIEQFNSGEVAYLLGQGCTIGADADAVTYSGSVWGQEIGKDDLPGLNGKTVYHNNRYEGCNNTSPVAEEFYSNTDQDIYGSHRGLEETGICQYCGLLEAAVLNEDGAYEISNAGQLYWFAGLVNGTLDGVEQNASANAILTADITINENLLASLRFDTDKDVTNGSSFRSWTMIGSMSNSYEGIFDGQDHTISGLYLNDSTLISAGLFGYISNGTIANVGIVDSYIRGKYNVGAVCGASNVGVIKNCYNTGTVTGIQNVGGLCGYAFSDSIISASYNTGTVNGTSMVGCICGEIAESVIVNCYNTGDVYGETIVGGLCGHNQNGTIVNCYSTGRVLFSSDTESAGGLCASNDGVIANCYYNNEMNNIVAASEGTGQLINVKAYTYSGFARGEVAYLLAQGCTVGEGSEAKFFDGSIWGLELGVEDTPLLNGKTVYRNAEYDTCSPEIGDPNYFYSNTKADPSFRDHEFSHGICAVCGKLENGRDAFLGASITLTDGVIVNYFLTLTEEALADPDAYIDFTTTQGVRKTVLLSEGIATEDGMYKFSLKLRPDQMAEKITAKVVYSDGTPGSEVTDYSVVDYVVALVGEDASEEEFALATALIQYGGAAQLYTGNNIENLADQSLPAFDPNVTISDDYAISLSGAVDGIKIKGASLMADALTTIRVRCEVTKGSISDYTFTCDGVELTPVKSGKYYYVYIRSISPKDLSHMYSIAVTDKSGSTRTLNYGVLSYAKSIIEAEEGMYDSSLVNMMKALYYYSEAAKNY